MALIGFQRNYNFTDSELCIFTSNLIGILTRDLSDLAVFGVSTINITNLNTLGDAFGLFPTDDSYIGEVMIATQDKNAKLETVKEIIRSMALRVSIKWGLNSGQYRRLALTGMNNFTEDKLLKTARSVHTIMTEYLSDLTSGGLTQQMLDDFEDANTAFENAWNTQSATVNMRDMKKDERITNGNELYSYVSQYCEIGKRVFSASDPAKYNDYIIYAGSSSGPLTPVMGLSFNIFSQVFSWTAQSNATSYSLEISADNINFTQIYSGAEPMFMFNPGAFISYYRCRARNNSGFGEFSTVVTVAYSSVLNSPQNVVANFTQTPNQIHLTWNAVSGAASYIIFGSEVEIGTPRGVLAPRGTSMTNTFTESVLLNKRYYYVVFAIAGAETSLPSNVIFQDTI